MMSEKPSFQGDMLRDLLNMQQCISDLSFALKLGDEIIFSDKYWSDFCKLINKKFPEICTKEFDNDGELHACEAGLWCYSKKIIINKEVAGFLSIGHRRLIGKDDETRKCLKHLLDSKKIDEDEYTQLDNYLNYVAIANEDQFNIIINRYVDSLSKILFIEAQHEKRIKELKTLSIHLAHSFLVPIQAIVARAENLLTGIHQIDHRYLNPDLIENSSGILDEVKKLSYSAENLRDWMMEERDVYRLELKHRVCIQSLLFDSVELFRSEAAQRGIVIHDPRPIYVPFPNLKISEPHMRKVFYNLINNAVKYSFDGRPDAKRPIDIVCKPSGNYYCIEITNYGVGILFEEKDSIWQYGYRGKLARDRNRFGSGMGLPAVRRIVEAHGGTVEIDSIMVGVAHDYSKLNPYRTTVRVFLPYD
jgi:signal transduction histidine kinase